MKKILFSVLVLLWLYPSVQLNAQNRPGGGMNAQNLPAEGIITGQVIDQNVNKPVEYANIAVYSMRDSSLVGGTISDASGNFRIEKLKYGKLYAVVDFIGYEKKIINNILVTPKQQQVSLDKIMLQQSSQQLAEVAVIADRPYMEYKIDKKVINVGQQLSAVGGTLSDVLENVPSIKVGIDGSISLRGSTNYKVLIDGKPSLLEGSDALQQLPASAIESLEIITNPSAKYDPDGTAGIINVIMKKKSVEGFSGMLNASYGTGPSYMTDGLFTVRTGKWNFLIGANLNNMSFPGKGTTTRTTQSDGITNILDSYQTGDRGHNGWSTRLAADYSITNNHTLSLETSWRDFGFERNNQTNYSEQILPANSHSYYNSNSKTKMGGSGYQINLSDALRWQKSKLDVTLSFGKNDNTESAGSSTLLTNSTFLELSTKEATDRTTDKISYNYRLNADYTYRRNENSSIETGYQVRNATSNGAYERSSFDPDTKTWHINTDESNTIDFRELIHAAYLTYSDKLGAYDIKLGLRGEYTDRAITQEALGKKYTYNSFDFFPSAYISRQFGEKHQLQANYSRRINRPRDFFLNPYAMHSDAFSVFRGNPDLKPEFSNAYELNYQYRFGQSFVAIETYYRNTENEMTRISTLTDGILYTNIVNLNSELNTGAELSANLQATKWLIFNPTANLYYYQVTNLEGDNAEYRSSNNWRARLNATIKFSMTSRLQISGDFNSASATATGTEKSNYSVDAAYRQEFFGRKLSLSFRISDIFDTRGEKTTTYGSNYTIVSDNKRRPRSFMLSLSYKINNYKVKDLKGADPASGGGGGMDMF